MKKKLLFTLILALALCFAVAIVSSATTYYVDSNGNLVDSTSDDIAYEYDCSNNKIANVYLHDSSVTKIVIPDMSDYTGEVQLQSNYDASLGVYTIEDKETKANSLITQIKEIVVHENIYLDGAYSVGTFAGYTGLEKVSFYGKVRCASKGGFWQNTNIKELNFYGKDIAVPSVMIKELKQTNEVTIIFHSSASGTLSTGYETLPTYSSLNNWKIIINENIKPSNPSDPRLGTKWSPTVVSTSGWELVVAIDSKSDYTEQQLEDFKTSHGFASRAASVDVATTKEAVVKTYCELGYDEHTNETSLQLGANGLLDKMNKIVGCSKCLSGETEEINSVFTTLGYSVSENGNMMQGFVVNKTPLAIYEELTGNKVAYGLLAGVKNYLTGTNLINSDGSANNSLGKIATVDFTNQGYDMFEIKVSGLTTDEYKALNVYCCAYYIVGEQVTYMSENVADTDISNMSTTYATEFAKDTVA